MDKKSVNPGLIFLFVLLVVIGIFLLYSRMSFTGYVTNVVNATNVVLLSSDSFETGDFSNTRVNPDGSVVLMPTKTTGTYTSQLFNAGQEVFWKDFVPTYVVHSSTNYTEDPVNNSITFYVRACNDTACTGKELIPYSSNLNLLGQYFQYVATMQIFSGDESPKLSEVNVSHYPPNTPPVNIWSPQNITYNNETILIKLSSNPGATIWFDNELYTEELNRTFSEGAHVLNVFVSYLDGNVNYTNSGSVAFSVGFLKIFYRFANNACSAVTLIQAQKTANDYNTMIDCQSHITTTTTTTPTTSETTLETCLPNWECSWGECVDGIQTEDCVDTSTCTTVAEPPPVKTQACTGGTTTAPTTTETTTTASTTTETPTTTPEKKGFFSFVGSAIVGPIFRSKIGIVFVILLVLVAGGFLAYKFGLKDKLKLKFFKNKKRFTLFN